MQQSANASHMPVYFTFLFPPHSVSVTSHFSLFYFPLSLWEEGETRGTQCYPNISPSPENQRLDVWAMRSSQWLHWSLKVAKIRLQCLGCSGFWVSLLRFKVFELHQLVFAWFLREFTHCGVDIKVSTTASLELEKYPGWIPSWSMTTISFQAEAAGGGKQKWTVNLSHYTQQLIYEFKTNYMS